jgi:hypothetical protein
VVPILRTGEVLKMGRTTGVASCHGSSSPRSPWLSPSAPRRQPRRGRFVARRDTAVYGRSGDIRPGINAGLGFERLSVCAAQEAHSR